MNYNVESLLPSLRQDITVQKYMQDQQEYLLIYDPMKYTKQPLLLGMQSLLILNALLHPIPKTCIGLADSIYEQSISAESILEFVKHLDNHGYLQTDRFMAFKKETELAFLNSEIREPYLAGSAYPEKQEDIVSFLHNIEHSVEPYPDRVLSGLIIPHADIKAGQLSYAHAIKALKASAPPDIIIMFATSHYSNADQFILTSKDFKTPLGITKTDKKSIDAIRSFCSVPLITDDSAHRAEHSIEIDLLILQYVYGASEFTLIPILVSGFHSFMTTQTDPFEHEKISSFVKSIQSYAKAEHKSVLFVSSGDLSHRGVKFGDDFHAQDHIQETALYDTGLIDSLCAGDAKGFYKHIADCKDQYRICGCSPNIMLLQTMDSAKGEVLSYQWWDQPETSSGVSFCTIAYFDEISSLASSEDTLPNPIKN